MDFDGKCHAGVGLLLIEKGGGLYIAAPPLAGSTSAEAGLKKGDRLLQIGAQAPAFFLHAFACEREYLLYERMNVSAAFDVCLSDPPSRFFS